MSDKESLIDERTRLTERLKQLNVNSPGRERIVQRIEAIDQELDKAEKQAV
jgi:hypothetical protein